jgi:hypothetical protein
MIVLVFRFDRSLRTRFGTPLYKALSQRDDGGEGNRSDHDLGSSRQRKFTRKIDTLAGAEEADLEIGVPIPATFPRWRHLSLFPTPVRIQQS